jgi:hypothetical protein
VTQDFGGMNYLGFDGKDSAVLEKEMSANP